MSDSTISNLLSGSPAQSSDELPIQRGSSNFKLLMSDISSYNRPVVQGIDATQYGVVGEGHFVFGVSVVSGQSTITYASGGFLANAKVGQIVFASNLGAEGFQAGAVLVVPQGTITEINSDTEITVSSTATATLSSSGCLVWGTDESSALETAWTAAVAANTMLILPAVNPEGTGPAVILVQSPQLNSGSVYGTGASRRGVGASGGGMISTYLVPTPSFAFPTSGGCFLDVNDGAYFRDFTIFGGGNGSCYSGSNSISGVLITDYNNVTIEDMAFLAWGASSVNGLPVGVQYTASESITRRCDFDMFGQTGVKCVASGNLGGQFFLQCSFWDNNYGNLIVAGGSNTPVFTYGCNFGAGGQQCVSVNGGGIWHDHGSQIGAGVEFINGILVGYTATPSGHTTGTGTAYLNGSDVEMSFENGGSCVYLNSSADMITLNGCILNNLSGSGTYCINNNGGILIDGGANTFKQASGGTLYNGTGVVCGALSITGVAQTTGNVSLTNFGSSPTVTAVSGNTRLQQFTITVGSTPTGTPTIAVTFPTPFLVAPIANLIQVGGTNALPSTAATFTPTTITATSATFTYDGTLTGGDTLLCQLYADIS